MYMLSCIDLCSPDIKSSEGFWNLQTMLSFCTDQRFRSPSIFLDWVEQIHYCFPLYFIISLQELVYGIRRGTSCSHYSDINLYVKLYIIPTKYLGSQCLATGYVNLNYMWCIHPAQFHIALEVGGYKFLVWVKLIFRNYGLIKLQGDCDTAWCWWNALEIYSYIERFADGLTFD